MMGKADIQERGRGAGSKEGAMGPGGSGACQVRGQGSHNRGEQRQAKGTYSTAQTLGARHITALSQAPTPRYNSQCHGKLSSNAQAYAGWTKLRPEPTGEHSTRQRAHTVHKRKKPTHASRWQHCTHTNPAQTPQSRANRQHTTTHNTAQTQSNIRAQGTGRDREGQGGGGGGKGG
jgi:hypothetical protein